jgi:GT2 family glycosyltransferase
MKTSILFLIFNRPQTTEKVFQAIKDTKPPKLYIAADGPRKDKVGEREKCEETRRIATQIDWDCEVKTLFRDENLGCGKAVSDAVSWFFQNEEEDIVLEDDVLHFHFNIRIKLSRIKRLIQRIFYITKKTHYEIRLLQESFQIKSKNNY